MRLYAFVYHFLLVYFQFVDCWNFSNIILEMGKQEQQKNKIHKTLRDKLRKKREQLKAHKKQKSQKRKQYDSQQQRQKYFEQTEQKKRQKHKKRQDGIKQYKLNKHIEKFVDIYEDDVDDFYELFENLDQGGSIDITGVQNPKMQKCLKKIFKYLPLKKKKNQYVKKEGTQTKLKALMKQLVTKSIDNYLENGTESERQKQEGQSQGQSSNQMQEEKQILKKKKVKKEEKKPQIDREEKKKKEAEIENKTIRQYQLINLYTERVTEKSNTETIGPFISAQQRQMLAKMFNEQQSIGPQRHLQQKQQNNHQNDQFQRIFAMAQDSSRKSKAQSKAKPTIDDLPDELLAEGSAKIGQKQQIDPQEIQEYNKIHRPRKLIEEHQQMLKIGKYAETDKDGKKKRVPFDRQRDIVYGRGRAQKNQGVFYDFSQRMTKPKSTNSFL